MKTQAKDRYLNMTAAGFSTRGVELLDVCVSPDGTVRVYDSVMGGYTLCHAMSAADQDRARSLAARPNASWQS